jgi:hypothetical protein
MDLNGGSYSRLNWWWYARPSPLFCVILRTLLVKKSKENPRRILMIHTGLLMSNYTTGYQILYPHFDIQLPNYPYFDIQLPNYPNCWISKWLQHVASGHSSHETLIWVMRIFVALLSRFHDSYETRAFGIGYAIRFVRKAFKSRIFFIFFPWNGPMLWGIFIIFY